MVDLATETFALPIWGVAVVIALFSAAAVLTFVQTGANDVLRTVIRAGLVFIGVVLTVWLFLDSTTGREREAERRAFEARLGELTIRAVAPKSALACLDAIAGEVVETACEKALFASPEVIAAATSYISARLNLLAQSSVFAGHSARSESASLSALRQSLESDRFGIVAQVLSLRDSCTPTQCDAFALLRDPTRIRANLKDRTFDGYVDRYSASWSNRDTSANAPTADASTPGAMNGTMTTATVTPATPGRPISHFDYPSASSIPPVSIMTPEPEPQRAPPAAAAAVPTPQRKPAQRAAAAPARAQTTPVPLAPPADAAAAEQ
jgi:hypothetical protein